MGFRNFSIWRGRLPHWRADGVCYYITFRHRRALDAGERHALFVPLMRALARLGDLRILAVQEEQTELMVQVGDGVAGRPVEVSRVVESAKNRAGKQIAKATGERFGPFYSESYDRIVRDRVEFEERLLQVAQGGEPFEDSLWLPKPPLSRKGGRQNPRPPAECSAER
ncbi:MAG: hypothetical protein HYR64_00220 [Fimbriimonas ginsengisoli]|uniref:Uncharacterized protein n=1 Tax=Fimbriimonas ginsengisoli TaxID=1005039 RepID=A0A931LV92_FIMGI|nr:hypothetical protein [Fimbriimonas ginsengisoli]